MKFGVYLGPTGKLKVLSEHPPCEEFKNNHWQLDEGLKISHKLFRFSIPVVKRMSVGWPVFDYRGDLKDHEYLGEL